jgi:hypothetical protein
MSIWKIHLLKYLFTDYVSKSYIDGRIFKIALLVNYFYIASFTLKYVR